jgi:quinol monooxygenase YgiN
MLPTIALCMVAPLFAFGADDTPSPIVAAVKPRLKDATKPFAILVTLRAKEGAGAKLEKAFADAVRQTKKEAGCAAYDLHRIPDDADAFILYERWKSLKDLEGHMKAPYIVKLLAEIHDLSASPPDLKVLVPAVE